MWKKNLQWNQETQINSGWTIVDLLLKTFTTCDHFVPSTAHAISGHTVLVLNNETLALSRHLFNVDFRKSVWQKESKHFNNIVLFFQNATHVSYALFLQVFDAVLDGEDVERLHKTFGEGSAQCVSNTTSLSKQCSASLSTRLKRSLLVYWTSKCAQKSSKRCCITFILT